MRKANIYLFILASLLLTQANTSFADTPCAQDILDYCKDIPQGSKISIDRCLYVTNADKISDACYDYLSALHSSTQTALRVCATDKQEFCADVLPEVGRAALFDCYWEHAEEISAECLQAIQLQKSLQAN